MPEPNTTTDRHEAIPSASSRGPIPVGIVPHTHWDREWYEPFQSFRLRLVRLLDDLLPLLEHDLSFRRFHLDGQTQVIDDYLEVRPEARERIRALATHGRISVGPWMILMDEFMVSGETIVRDLQMGIARATEFGGAMPVGYLPDMFGHIGQMPQILRSAGFEHAIVWRGVPAAITQSAFWWEAPDGSRVRAEYLLGSYSNAQGLEDDAQDLVERTRLYDREMGDGRLSGGGLLLMNGTDHQVPQPWLGRVVAEANEIQGEYRFEVTSPAEYVAAQPSDGLTTWPGELRSGARANVLMGVASNRVDVHRACAAAERAVEKLAEPLSALLLPPTRFPHAELQLAWRNLVLDSAHDSSCACSHDDVVDAVVVRYQEARHIGEGLGRTALHHLAGQVDAPSGATLVVNPTSHARGGLVELTVPGEGPVHLVAHDDGAAAPTQVTADAADDLFTIVLSGPQMTSVLPAIRGSDLAGVRLARGEVEEMPDGIVEVRLYGARPGEASLADDDTELRERMSAFAADDRTFHIRIIPAPMRRVLAHVPDVPSFGWRSFTAREGAGPAGSVQADGLEIANDRIRVRVDGNDGTFSITAGGRTFAGLGRLVDGGDGGDTYNYSPPAVDRVVDRPDSVAVTTLESGPVRARLVVDARYTWPAHALGNAQSCTARSENMERVDVRTVLTLLPDEPFVRVHTSFHNVCRDHRLRAHFPLPEPVSASRAECAFAVVERGLTAEGGPHEPGLPTFVSRRFVDASEGGTGVALLHDGLLEYELVEDGRELALTLARCTGYLSRSEPALRPNAAGPLDPLEGPQLQRDLAFDYAVFPHVDDVEGGLHAAADAFLVPLQRIRVGSTRSTAPATHSALRVHGAVVSAVTREPGGLVVRVFNPGRTAGSALLELDGAPTSGWIVDLRGRPIERFEGEIGLLPGRIATLRPDPRD